MAEQARVLRLTPKIRMVGPVVTGAHSPRSTALRIPAHWKFDEPAFIIPIQKRLGMISRPDDVVHALFYDACAIGLSAPQIESASAIHNGVTPAGCLVKE